ncbi:helix-turn-helix domain-containing protein [Nocardia testacea]|uniref:Helix-turn-helix domain-containing protein n=1 Tax=Nocardia testacea TaxID=248551 RepID=A0ABW7VSC9_9NOCA
MSPAEPAPIRHRCAPDRSDSLPAWRAGIEDFFPRLRIEALDSRFAGSIKGARSHELQVNDIAGTAHHAARRPTGRRASEADYFKLEVQLEGTGFVRQDGSEARLEPGSIVIYDFAQPYDLVFDGDTRFLVALFPKRALGLPEKLTGELLATPLASTAGTAPLVASYLSGLADNLGLLAGPSAPRVSRLFLDLVSTFLGEQLDRRVGRGATSALTLAIVRYLDQHLADPELDAARIAEANHISVRYLHRLFEPTGVSVGQWIRQRRLEQARDALADPGRGDLAVAEIAHRCGFVDAGYFGRVFKQRFGTPPGQWREAHALSSHPSAR